MNFKSKHLNLFYSHLPINYPRTSAARHCRMHFCGGMIPSLVAFASNVEWTGHVLGCLCCTSNNFMQKWELQKYILLNPCYKYSQASPLILTSPQMPIGSLTMWHEGEHSYLTPVHEALFWNFYKKDTAMWSYYWGSSQLGGQNPC